jgi:ABC-type Mn2+/Zn2+ transport system permease subunit
MTWLVQLISEHRLAAWTILAAAVSNASCAILGCYLVLRRMSLLGDAISHAVLPGIVVAFLFFGKAPLPALAGAMVVGMLTTYATQALSSSGGVAEDSSMGIVYTSLFALGVFLLTNVARNVDLDPGCVLYGAIEFVPLDTLDICGIQLPRALLPMGAALAATLVFVALLWKELKIVCFDADLALALGLRSGLVHYLLMGMVAVVTVAAFEAVGSILVVAMLIVPGATAHLLTDRLDRMLLYAVGVGIVSAVLGYWGAVYLNTTVAGMMAVAAGGQFALAVLLAPRHGLVSKAASSFALSLRIVAEDLLAMLYRAEELSARSTEPARLSWPQCAVALGGGPAAWLSVLAARRRGRVRVVSGLGVELTERGRESARSLVRSHRLWEAFLVEYFDLPLDHLHAPAERVEHYIGPQLQESLAAAVHATAVDPHGREIPPADSAEKTPSTPAG